MEPQPKTNVLIDDPEINLYNFIYVHCDSVHFPDILAMGSVADGFETHGHLCLHIDERYDMHEVKQHIRKLCDRDPQSVLNNAIVTRDYTAF